MKRGRAPLIALAAGAVVAAGLALTTPGTTGGFVAKVTNSADTAGTAPYFTCAGAMTADNANATLIWPLNEASSSTQATDSSGHTNTGTYSGTMTSTASPSACSRDTGGAYTLNGTSSVVVDVTKNAGPSTFSLEVWFKTASTTGGLLLGLGSGASGATSTTSLDRVIYMKAAGNLVFGVKPSSGAKMLTSPSAYNDGAWHHVVATMSPTAGAAMYVDGSSVATDATMTSAATANNCYWRAGYDALSSMGWTGTTTNYFAGSLRFAGVYTVALNSTQVANRWIAGS